MGVSIPLIESNGRHRQSYIYRISPLVLQRMINDNTYIQT